MNNETLAQHQCLYWAFWSAEMTYLEKRSFSNSAAPSYRRGAAIGRLHLQKKGKGKTTSLPLHSPNPPSITQRGDIAEDKFTFLSYCHQPPPSSSFSFHHPALLLLASSQEEATMDLIWPEAKERSESLPLPQDSTDLCRYFP